MRRRRFPLTTFRTVIALLAVAAAVTVTGVGTHAQSRGPLTADDFRYSPIRGFGDRSNSWAQAMAWWHDHLYVGTARESLCTSQFAIWKFAAAVFGQVFADAFLPYPSADPELPCPADGADLPLQAEIWRWTPAANTWDLAYRSANDLDNPGPPAQPGKKLPYEIAFRGMTPHTDPNGTEALYAFGLNSGVMWDTTKIPPPRILRTTDGDTWTPVPQTPGTFLGDLPFNTDHSSFRSPVSFKGKLFVLCGPIFGQGSLIGSADPAAGDNAWFLASPDEVLFYEMATFNGWLYLGTFSQLGGGYSVVKTRAEGAPPYQFVTVVPVGAYHPDPLRPSRSVVSMNEFHGRLYVGTASNTEVLRINPDDTWDLVVGPPRRAPAVGGGTEWKYPLSGLDNGFGHSPNDHAWQMADLYGDLYIGTYNATLYTRYDPVVGPLLAHNMGTHLYRTGDGWYYNAVTTNGFANLGDSQGGRYDFGLRTMTPTPYGAFMGTANDNFGLTVLRAKPAELPLPPPPQRLEVEPVRTGGALLSWLEVPQAEQYQVWRAERLPIVFRTEVNIEAWNTLSGNYIVDTYVGPYQQVATTNKTYYVDRTVQTDHKYMYYVVQVTGQHVSEQSNLVGFPLLTPAMSFATLQRQINKTHMRRRLRGNTEMGKAYAMLSSASSAAVYCRLEKARSLLIPESLAALALEPESQDLEIMASKLWRRLALFEKLPLEMTSTEICIR